MNQINFQQSVGFPLETDILNSMQEAYSIFNEFGHILGNKTIISGCVTTGTTVSNGFIFLNGELIEFRGGAIQPDIIILEDITSLEFEDLSVNEVVKLRYATFGTAVTSYPWADFMPVAFLKKGLTDISFDFVGSPPVMHFLLVHNLDRLDYMVLGDFTSDISDPGIVDTIATYSFSVWQKTPQYCYLKTEKISSVPGVAMTANFKIIY